MLSGGFGYTVGDGETGEHNKGDDPEDGGQGLLPEAFFQGDRYAKQAKHEEEEKRACGEEEMQSVIGCGQDDLALAGAGGGGNIWAVHK
jgi:hypothetical protein